MRTIRRMGLRSVAVHSTADPGARHVRAADAAVCVGGPSLAESYLDAEAIVAAAVESGARMVHPGYGFLAENADFARRCAQAGLVFIGPPPEAIEAMGDKISAKARVAEAGVPLLPGFAEEPGRPMDEDELARAAERTGYPLLIKPSAGGGGKGMRVVHGPSELAAAAAAARREAEAAFGDRTLLVERLVRRPRHVEVQVLADRYGNVLHLGERECSLQRRHQKIVEESPSPLLSSEQRSAMGEAAVAAAKACGYVGAGTVEFIVEPPEADAAEGADAAVEGPRGGAADGGPEQHRAEAPGEPLSSSQPDPAHSVPPRARDLWTADAVDYSFLEMNTRLQVEHPVTEAVAAVGGRRGIDLVELQIRVARGEPLPFAQADVSLSGHAVEARVYAEDPANGFLPTGGRVLLLDEPAGADLRVDSGLDEGTEITSAYDPMLAKVVAWAPDRAGALDRMDAALADYTLLGCDTNVSFLRALLGTPQVRAGALSTDLTEQLAPELSAPADGSGPAADSPCAPPPDALIAAAADHQLGLEPDPRTADRFAVPDGWRIGEPGWTAWRLRSPRHGAAAVRVRRRPSPATAAAADPQSFGAPPLVPGADTQGPLTVGYEVSVDGGPPVAVDAARSPDGRTLTVALRSRTLRYARAAERAGLWLGREGAAWRFEDDPVLAPSRAAGAAGDGTVRSPMPGTVLSLAVAEGERVVAGSPVAVVEAMKMEHTVTAPVDGTVSELPVRPGRPVAMDALLARITPEPAATPPGSGGPDSAHTTLEE
ncbi:acetyl/propionyl/methylcrotonyl-CoA carboxylase subunit alpha [Streptomonospora wellingtoniae]|uniref:biotin carboxylase n=1 Tax=Streptomonospora wellingtoniae TaxID=3075544 RepID=A0ABU2KP15_9ACTN|nr:biotin carboxylase N-terminal domain-containing protein [Streptomonospora sp. DSM 45055]MDT0300956.1 biotin carboxylase N-terminal domain-containing protein [Streptomonospora sp. DSM 45055]